MAPCRKQPWRGILDKEKHDAGKGDDTERQRNQFASAAGSNLHNPLFPAACKESIKAPLVAPTV